MRKIVGLKTFKKSVRLFVVPGMGHCGGGDCAADTFEKLETIVDWHESGEVPDVLDALHVVSGTATFTRPLCAYPKWARYNGSGDPSKAENFTCTLIEGEGW